MCLINGKQGTELIPLETPVGLGQGNVPVVMHGHDSENSNAADEQTARATGSLESIPTSPSATASTNLNPTASGSESCTQTWSASSVTSSALSNSASTAT